MQGEPDGIRVQGELDPQRIFQALAAVLGEREGVELQVVEAVRSQ